MENGPGEEAGTGDQDPPSLPSDSGMGCPHCPHHMFSGCWGALCPLGTQDGCRGICFSDAMGAVFRGAGGRGRHHPCTPFLGCPSLPGSPSALWGRVFSGNTPFPHTLLPVLPSPTPSYIMRTKGTLIRSFAKGFIKTQKTKTHRVQSEGGGRQPSCLCPASLMFSKGGTGHHLQGLRSQSFSPHPAGTPPFWDPGLAGKGPGPSAGQGTARWESPLSPGWGSGSHSTPGVQDTHTHPTGPFWVIVLKKILCLKKTWKLRKKPQTQCQ